MGVFEWTVTLILIPLVVGVIGGIISNFLTPPVKDWYARRSVRSAEKRLEQIQVELEEVFKYAADSESLTHFVWESFALILFCLSLAGMAAWFAGLVFPGEAAYQRSDPSSLYTLPVLSNLSKLAGLDRTYAFSTISWFIRVVGLFGLLASISLLNRAAVKSREIHVLLKRIRNLSTYSTEVEKRRTELSKVISQKEDTSDAISAKPEVIETEEGEEIRF